jgi:NarL family two-component system response regulator LiaR
MYSIFIIEDHPVMRKGLASHFAATGRWQVLGIASSLEEARALLSQSAIPDIILLDIQLNNQWGLDLIPWLKERYPSPPEVKEPCPAVAVYSHYTDYLHVQAALRLGVGAYVCKSRGEDELEEALNIALSGGRYLDPAAETGVNRDRGVLGLLTKREAEIFALVKSGLSNSRIAAALGLAPHTVENILSILYDKTGTANRGELEMLG